MITLNQIPTYDEIMELTEQLYLEYPNLLTRESIGMSQDQRRMPALILGSSPKILICTGGIHGRESINTILLLKILEEYCQILSDQSVEYRYPIHRILSTFSIAFLPLMNPDGYEIATGGFDRIRNPKLRQAMKMRGIPASLFKYNGNGVDINRNFPCKTFQSLYTMPTAGSEPETRALMEFFRKHPQSVGYLDFHSRGRIIYYYRSAMSRRFNSYSRKIAKHIQNISYYELGTQEEEKEDLYSGGNSVQYYSEIYKKPAITIETLDENTTFPIDVSQAGGVYLEIFSIPLTYLDSLGF